jgi:DNA-binding LytR/AlgR family response regulator
MDKILIIEDDKSYIENITLLLEEEGFQVISAENGFDGIELAKSESPDLIICDIMLPDIDGYTILKELRKRKKTKFIPFIFLTAKAEMTDLRTGMNLGADDYLTKPFRADDLLTTVKTRLEKASLVYDVIKKAGDQLTDKRRLEQDDYIFLPGKNNYDVLLINDIVCIYSDGVYTNVISRDGKKVLVRKLLKEWEDTLPDKFFIRIHKSSMINLKYLKKVDKWFNGSLKIYLDHYDKPLFASRRYASKLKKGI